MNTTSIPLEYFMRVKCLLRRQTQKSEWATKTIIRSFTKLSFDSRETSNYAEQKEENNNTYSGRVEFRDRDGNKF